MAGPRYSGTVSRCTLAGRRATTRRLGANNEPLSATGIQYLHCSANGGRLRAALLGELLRRRDNSGGRGSATYVPFRDTTTALLSGAFLPQRTLGQTLGYGHGVCNQIRGVAKCTALSTHPRRQGKKQFLTKHRSTSSENCYNPTKTMGVGGCRACWCSFQSGCCG